jgi:hypothetical protein
MQSDAPVNDEPKLNPVDRCTEVLFGLIMAVTIVGSLSIANPGSEGVRPVLAAALGCNLAWGMVDAVMHLVRTVTERTRMRSVALRAISADAPSAHLLIQENLPSGILAITGTSELEGMRRRLVSLAGPVRPLLDWHDVGAAVRIFLFVVLATFPVVIPFLLTDNLARALHA